MRIRKRSAYRSGYMRDVRPLSRRVEYHDREALRRLHALRATSYTVPFSIYTRLHVARYIPIRSMPLLDAIAVTTGFVGSLTATYYVRVTEVENRPVTGKVEMEKIAVAQSHKIPVR